jgi:SNF2 family DNA or RNA helicase
MVCDEAQKIKNPAALITHAANAIQARFKVACTGTPVENTLVDLWSLFDFAQPGLLGRSMNLANTMFALSRTKRVVIQDSLKVYER